MKEPFSLSKFFDFTPLVWAKALKIGICFFLVGLVGLTLWKAFFSPAKKTTQQTTFSGNVENVVLSQTETNQKWITPFIEIYGETQSFHKVDIEVGARAGLRVSW